MNPTLIEMLKSSDETDRKFALEDIQETRDWTYVPFVLACLADPSISVREAAAEVLIDFKCPEGIAWAVRTLSSENVKSRNQAVEILMGIGHPALEQLQNVGLVDLDPDVRKLSLDVIGAMQGVTSELHPELFSTLRVLINDSNLNVACSAIEALGKFKDDRSVPLLLEAMGNNEWLQNCIVESLINNSSDVAIAGLKFLSQRLPEGFAKKSCLDHLGQQGDRKGKAS